jgi:inosose dehydratase
MSASIPTDLSKLRLGTAPDSWGVWFPDDPKQVHWSRFLDEARDAGYKWVELGPYGYLPTDPGALRSELVTRGLTLTGGAVFVALHRGASAYEQAVIDCDREARLLTALDAEYLVILPEGYTDLDGNVTQPSELTDPQWDDLCTGMDRLGKHLLERWGLKLVFHSHADSHIGTQAQIERFLDHTDPRFVNVCLDTGHVAYCGADNLRIIERYPERILYVHLKQVDRAVRQRVQDGKLGFAPAVRLGAMVEPPDGDPPMEPLLAALGALDRVLYCIVEQDMYPCAPDVPYPIAHRTQLFFAGCGLGAGRPVVARS